MRKFLSAGFAVLSMFLIPGCAGTSKVAVTAADSASPLPAAKPLEYGSLREAMQNLDFIYLGTREISDHQRRFVETLRWLTQGREMEAERQLRELHASAADPLLLKDVDTILGTMLFYQSRWEELLNLDPLPGGPEKESRRLLAGAYQGSSRENLAFPSTSDRLPTTFTASGVPTIEVTVNGKRKKFLLDSGAGMTVVSHELARECRIFPLSDREAKAGTSTSKRVGIRPAVIADFKIGNLSIKNHPVMIIDQGNLQFKLLGLFIVMKIEGIIGWNAIRNLHVDIDYQNKVTTLTKPERREVPNRNLFLLGGYPVVRLRSEEGIPLNFGLDTGARESWITDNLLKKIENAATTRRIKKIGSAGGSEKVEAKVLPELNLILNGCRLTFKKIGTRPARLDEFVEMDGVLGGDVFKKGRILINFQNGVFDFSAPGLHDNPAKGSGRMNMK